MIADLIVGTSAGSVLAAALRCGTGIDEMIAHQRREAVGALADAGVSDVTGGPWPPPPTLRVGSPRLMLTSPLMPHRVHPGAGASAWMLRGRGTHQALRSADIRVTVLTPGPDDLAVMGVNLLDPRRRRIVLETSLTTSAGTLAATPSARPGVA